MVCNTTPYGEVQVHNTTPSGENRLLSPHMSPPQQNPAEWPNHQGSVQDSPYPVLTSCVNTVSNCSGCYLFMSERQSSDSPVGGHSRPNISTHTHTHTPCALTSCVLLFGITIVGIIQQEHHIEHIHLKHVHSTAQSDPFSGHSGSLNHHPSGRQIHRNYHIRQ